MNNGLVRGLTGLIELGCVLTLAGIALKRNNDAYHAECKLDDARWKLACSEAMSELKDIKIELLEKELEELKSE